jgi:FkbM family methyltransferase
MHRTALLGLGYGLAGPQESGELAVLASRSSEHPGARTIIDVGANVGGWALEAADAWPNATIHAFEPSAHTYDALQVACAGRSIVCVRAALSDRAGTAELHAVPTLPGLSSLHVRDLAEHGLEMSETETVRVTTLDAYCLEQDIDHVDFLKIDAEGHDLAVLQGAPRLIASGAVDAIQFEFGGANIDSRTFLRDFVRLLEPAYDLHRILVDGLAPLAYGEREEVFVTSNFLALRR